MATCFSLSRSFAYHPVAVSWRPVRRPSGTDDGHQQQRWPERAAKIHRHQGKSGCVCATWMVVFSQCLALYTTRHCFQRALLLAPLTRRVSEETQRDGKGRLTWIAGRPEKEQKKLLEYDTKRTHACAKRPCPIGTDSWQRQR